MINKIIEYCAHNKFIVLLFIAMATLLGLWSLRNITLDAIPDLSDTQVIIYSRWDRSPDIMEDQVTYPIISSLLGVPKVKDIRGFSDFGYSYVYIIFEDGTDLYWARSRTLEYLSNILPKLPQGVNVELARDETAVGWVFQYALVDKSGKNNLAQLRSFQDWYLRYAVQAVPGVAEVAPLGGFVKQYQVNIDPNALLAYDIPIDRVVAAVRQGNQDVGGRLVEFSGREYMVRGRGYIKSLADVENIVVGTNKQGGTPVLVKNLATVTLGPDIRRGVGELDGEGETVGGIVIMRYGENARTVIERVRTKLEEMKPSLPPGVEIVTTYDRAELIDRAIETLKGTLIEEIIIVSLVIMIFLWHFPSALVPIITIPITVIIAFIPMYGMNVTANIMSLGGIAVAIGAMVDAAIVVVEQTHKKLEHWNNDGRPGDYRDVVISAVKEVGGPSFFALLVIAVSFIPVFTLEAQEGRLFKPLAYTKNFSMAIAALLAITLDPAIRLLFTRMDDFKFRPRWLAKIVNAILVGKIHSEESHPISRPLMKLYHPVCNLVLRFKWLTVGAAVLIVAVTIPVYEKLGSEFMPPLDEGVLLYMPTTLPGMSVTQTQQLLQVMDKRLKQFPEVERVFGKAGRAETATDPAPFSMMETVVSLKPHLQWPKQPRWYSSWTPNWLQGILRKAWPDHKTMDELIYGPGGLNEAMQFPGVSNAWTMPIKARVDMLTTGIRTPIGIKIMGADLQKVQQLGEHIEMALQNVPGTKSVFAERTAGGYFLDFTLKREELARYGLTIDEANDVVMSAVGGENVTTTIEGRERYPVNVRYLRDYRSDLDRIGRTLVMAPGGTQIPIAQIADIKLVSGPAMIRDENGRLSGYVYVDLDTSKRDIGSYVAEAKKILNQQVQLPAGYQLIWSGQYENMERVKDRLVVVLPITIFVIFLLLYFNTKSVAKTIIILLAVPFSAVGAIWFLYLLGYNMSIAVWVGLIALMGVDAETGMFMLLYLDIAYQEAKAKGMMRNKEDLKEAILHGAVKRLRPKVMTVGVMFMGLVPIMWSQGSGADVMKRIAAPMIGGIFTSFILELAVYPAIYEIWKWYGEVRGEAKRLRLSTSAPFILLALGLLTLTAKNSAQSTANDPVVRAMAQVQATVDAHAAVAEKTLSAMQLVNASNEAKKLGKNVEARATLVQAENLVTDISSVPQRSALVNVLRQRLAEEQAALNPTPQLIPSSSVPARQLFIAMPRSVVARYHFWNDPLTRILREENVPPELLAVALVESGFNPQALSPKGARGIWQLMPDTARRYGLTVAEIEDHRTHPEHSTRAAARYLRDLYQQFGDWKLALAAYNWGEGNLQRVINRTGLRDFDELARRGLLPLETRNYVPAVLTAWAQLRRPTSEGEIQ
ncbi:MAG: efflux RND transporter permease subunit [Acidobacteria bacterium]|nr:efflux RND transporter permease subunit [Acidobacteriota bacterium]